MLRVGHYCNDIFLGSAAIGDVDGDGKSEVVAGSMDRKMYVWDTKGITNKDWTSFHHDAQNTGRLYKIVSGILSSSTSWSGEISIVGDVTVASGVTLTILPGTILKFNNYSSLSVYGALTAQGIIDVDRIPITFDFISPNNQNGIKFYSGSSGTLNVCDIKNGYYGVFCNGYLPNIVLCNITNNITGIYIYNAGVQTNNVGNNTIQYNSSDGIFIAYSSPRNIYGNTIRYNGQAGIYAVSYSTPYIYNNTITNNGAAGITCASLSPARFEDWSRWRGYNLITGNYCGVGCGYESDVLIGTMSEAAYNSIHDNTSYEVRGEYDSHVLAENNWWNRQPPSYPNYYYSGDFYTSYSGTVDYDPALHSNPVGGMMKAVASGVESNSDQSGKSFVQEVSGSNSFFDSELRDALDNLADGKYEEALAKYEQRFKKETDTGKKKYVLRRMAECYNLSEKKGFIDFLNNGVRQSLSKDDELYAETLLLENMFLIGVKKYDEAVDNFEILKKDFSENEGIVKTALFNLVCLNYNQLDDVNKGKEYLDELKSRFPDDDLTLNAMLLTGEIDSFSILKLKKEIIVEKEAPDKYELSNNYPNPFNPTTIINYQIPNNNYVTLKVYDILGNVVKTLVDGYKTQGSYIINFNASSFASGVYFYQLRAGNFTATKKLLLLK